MTEVSPGVAAPAVDAAPAQVEAPAAVVAPAEVSPTPVEYVPAPTSTDSILSEATIATPEDTSPEVTQEAPGETPQAPVYDFKLPEGVQLAEKEYGQFKSILTAANVPPEKGQELVDLYLSEVGKMHTAQQEAWQSQNNKWREEVLADREIGGNRFKTAITACASVLDEYGSPELRQAMTQYGLGNHPAMVRFVYKVSQALGEGRSIPASKSAEPAPASRTARMYNGG
jgi:hypothetical protein